MSTPRRPVAAIAGLGFSELSRKPIGTSRELAADAVRAAIADAGLGTAAIDGLLLNRSPSAEPASLPLRLREDLGLGELRLLCCMEAEGSSAVQMVQYAALAVNAGMASAVACVFSDARIGAEKSSADAYARPMSLTGIDGWEARYGLFGATGPYALAARRYMAERGLGEEHLGAVAISNRKWAAGNPRAFLRTPLDMEQYLASRWVVEPLRMLDCAYPVNGAVAVVVTSAARAADTPKPPVYIHGMGQGHAARTGLAGDSGIGAERAGAEAYRMAGIAPHDVQSCQFYDAFSYSVLQMLEEYGVCEVGAAGEFVAGGGIAPGGEMPVNTGGGQLSGYYLQGMTPLSEAVIQARGEGGARQVAARDLILVGGVGGVMDYHAALVLSPHEALA